MTAFQLGSSAQPDNGVELSSADHVELSPDVPSSPSLDPVTMSESDGRTPELMDGDVEPSTDGGDPERGAEDPQEQTAPARVDDGDAVNCKRTFLFGCSMASLKEMAACNRCANQSPPRLAPGSTFIAMSDVNITSILKQGTMLAPMEAVDMSAMFEAGGSVTRDLLDAFNNYTLSHPDKATDGSPASEMETLPDAEPAASVSQSAEAKATPEAATTLEAETSTEATGSAPPAPTEPRRQVDVATGVAERMSSDVMTDVMTTITSQVDLLAPNAQGHAAGDSTASIATSAIRPALVNTEIAPSAVAEMTLEFAPGMVHIVGAETTPELETEVAPEGAAEMAHDAAAEMTSEVAAETAPEMEVGPDASSKYEVVAEIEYGDLSSTRTEMEHVGSSEFEVDKLQEAGGSTAEEESRITSETNLESPPNDTTKGTEELVPEVGTSVTPHDNVQQTSDMVDPEIEEPLGGDVTSKLPDNSDSDSSMTPVFGSAARRSPASTSAVAALPDDVTTAEPHVVPEAAGAVDNVDSEMTNPVDREATEPPMRSETAPSAESHVAAEVSAGVPVEGTATGSTSLKEDRVGPPAPEEMGAASVDDDDVRDEIAKVVEKGTEPSDEMQHDLGESTSSDDVEPAVLPTEEDAALRYDTADILEESAISEVRQSELAYYAFVMSRREKQPFVDNGVESPDMKPDEEDAEPMASETAESFVLEMGEDTASANATEEKLEMTSPEEEIGGTGSGQAAGNMEEEDVSAVTVEPAASAGEKEMSEVYTDDDLSDFMLDTNRRSSSTVVLQSSSPKTSQMDTRGRPSMNDVREETAAKHSETSVPSRTRQNRKRKSSSASVSTDLGYDTDMSQNLQQSTDERDDIEMDTEAQDQSATGPLSKTKSEMARGTTSAKKRHANSEVAVVPSKTQRKTLSQQHVGGHADDKAEAANYVPCLPLESIVSLLRRLAGIKTGDRPEVDALCPIQAPAEVLEDYSFVISQCDVNKNQNTYFICQVLKTSPNEAYVWHRCGRMGRVSSKALMGPMSPHIAAIVEFTRMYQNKTGHNWFWVSAEERRQPKVGSYGELDIDYSQTKLITPDSTTRSYLETAYEYIRSIVSPDQDIITAGSQTSLLGRLSMAQVLRGYDLLEQLEQIVKKARVRARLRQLSSLYYATIPHDFGKERMAIIESESKIEGERKFLLTNYVLPALNW